jgi:hypothetical protein
MSCDGGLIVFFSDDPEGERIRPQVLVAEKRGFLRSSDKTQILENALPHRTLAPESEANDTHREQVPGLLDFQ